jgi:hypothetical protein
MEFGGVEEREFVCVSIPKQRENEKRHGERALNGKLKDVSKTFRRRVLS